MKEREVGVGECLASIAFENGFFYETLWEHDRNAALKEKRQSPHILLAGDVVHVPDLRVKTVEAATGRRHTFRRRGVPEVLELRLLDDAVPRADVPYVLTIDGVKHTGRTDAEGRLRHYIAPNAAQGTLTLHPGGEQQEELDVLLRRLDPIDAVSGLAARLANLGFYAGGPTSEKSPALQEALLAFQRHHRLDPSGELDAATRSALLHHHGS